MITILAKLFIKSDMTNEKQRSMYGFLCGFAGIGFNLLLFLGKFIAGTISNSIAITADAFNNLSDAGSSVVTLIGFKLAGQKPDPDHPFGHGRMEYIAGFSVSMIILLMAVELLRSSVEKIIHPESTEFSAIVLVILICSILIKCYMAFYNFTIGKKINSAAIRATGTDSLSDCIATTVVLISTLVGHFANIQIDGIGGVIVGLFILYAGFSAAKDTLDPLLGQPPEKEFVDEIVDIVTGYDKNILGVHDLVVHDYGPGRCMISLHAEVPANGDIVELHDIIDNIEEKLVRTLGCVATIHMDPITTTDEQISKWKEQILSLIHQIDPIITMHDFRVVEGETHNNFIFDVVVPFQYKISDEDLTDQIKKAIKDSFGKNFYAIIRVDKDYVHGKE